ncbi:MAG: class I SAM-dependent rRNA methyltransferase, partial [bacterium]
MLTKAVYTVRKNCWSGHPWIYSSEVRRVESEAQLVGSEPLCKDQIPGELVRVYDRNRFIGSGMFNPHSLIAVRLYSERDEELNEDLITARIEAAYRYRQKRLPGEEDFRLVYGESDRLPGLVIDKYGSHFAVQVYAAGFDNRLDMVVNSLCRLFAVRSIFEKDDIKLREPEGLKRRERLLYGTPEREILISENGVKFYVDIVSGQKTGYFFDHRLTRRKVRKLAKNRRVLDVFCYTGSFAINAALGEAKEVKAIDISPDACARARDNAVLN